MITNLVSKNSILAKIGSISLSIYIVAMSFAGVTVFPGIAAAVTAATLTVDTVNGHPPTGICLAGTITITAHGQTGGQGGTWHVAIGWGDGATTTISTGDPQVTSGDLNGGGDHFTLSATHTPTGNSSGLTVMIYHSSLSGSDGPIIIVSQCVAAPTQGVVVLAKHVINDNAGVSSAAAFTLGLSGTGTTTPGVEAGATPGFKVNPGSYTISDTGPAGYHRTTTACTDNGVATSTPSDTLSVYAGHNYKCTVTNDDNVPAPTTGGLVVTKTTVGGNGTFAFTGGAGAFTITTANNTGTKSISNLAPGSISVSETAQTGWAQTANTCSNVTITAGATSTCSITNTKAGGITIIKNVAGSNALASSFALTVSDANNATVGTDAGSTAGVSYYNVAPGTYTVSEPANAHYSATYSSACNGTNSFTVTSGATSTCTVTNTYHNAVPVANNKSISTNEDTPVSDSMTGSDSDSDTFVFSILGMPANGLLSGINTNTGAFTYTPNANYNGSDSFTFQVTDSQGATSNTGTVSITVNPVNDNPVANDDSASMPQDSASTTIAVLTNDTDVDGNTLTVTGVSGASHGTTDTNGTNAIYKPAAGYVGTDSFTYTISDGNGGTASATVHITVSNVEEAPVAVADSYNATEDTLLTVIAPGVLSNDSDPDAGDVITAVKVTNPSHGTVTLNADGSVAYMPASNYCGSDSFTYKANDGQMDSSVVTVSIAVACVNDAPVAQNQNVETDQNVSTSSVAVATDVEGDTLTYATTSNPLHGTLTFGTSGAFTYIPAFGYLGSDSFTFKANDGQADSNTGTVSITVDPVKENTFAKCTDGIDNDGDGKIDLADPDCAPFLPQLVIKKTAIGGDATFGFTVTAGESTASLTSITTSEGSGQSNAIALQPGSYTVTELNTAGWNYTSSSCTYTNQFEDESQAVGNVNIQNHSEQLDTLGAGDVVTCTFTNTIIPTNADVSVVKTVDNNNPAEGDHVTYTLTVHNAGPANATNVVVTDALPSGVTYVSDTGDGSYSTSTNTWTIGTLADGLTATLSITVSVNKGTLGSTITNTATESANNADTNEDNDSSSVSISVGKDLCPNIEGVQLTIPAGKVISGPDCVDDVQSSGGGGGGGGGNGPISGGFGGNGPIGQVLGASTSLPELPAGCTALITTYMRSHNHKNDSSEVKKLQGFLNSELGLHIPVSGVFGPLTQSGVNTFQAKYKDQVLTPWNLSAPTGFVYRTTQRWVNLINCKDLNIPLPTDLIPYHHEDQQ